MSFDAFEARMQFLQLLKKLNASAQSIQKVVGFAVKYGSRCGEDLWEVIMDECEKGTLNTRINILYFLDSLLDVSHSLGPPHAPYLAYIARDLGGIVERVVPETREGVLNLRSARQILDSWRTRRVIDVDTIDSVLKALSARSFGGESSQHKRGHSQAFSRDDIIRRMEEDRERHKRLRERIWILPIPPLVPKPPGGPGGQTSTPHSQTGIGTSTGSSSNPSPASPFTPASPSTLPASASASARQTSAGGSQSARESGVGLLGKGTEGKMLPPPPPAAPKLGSDGLITLSALEMEFEQTWEGAGELGDDDLFRMSRDAASAGLSSTNA